MDSLSRFKFDGNEITNQNLEDGAALLRWNVVSWFGLVIGTCAWMLCAGVYLLANLEVIAGSIALVCSLCGIICGVVLWKLRHRVLMNIATIVILAATWISVTIAIASINLTTSQNLLARLNWPTNPLPLIAFLTIVFGAAIWMNYNARRTENAG